MLHPIWAHGLHHLRQERSGGICIHINAGTSGRPVKHGEASILEGTTSFHEPRSCFAGTQMGAISKRLPAYMNVCTCLHLTIIEQQPILRCAFVFLSHWCICCYIRGT